MSDKGSRVSRNEYLYREVYGKYDSVGNLPIHDNTNEIDMDSLKRLLREDKTIEEDVSSSNYDFVASTKRNFNDEKIYDINEMLKKAKDENSKINVPSSYSKSVVNKNILSTLTNNELLLEDIKKEKERRNSKIDDEDSSDNISMTREYKFSSLQDKVDNTSVNLSTELFSNLKDDELVSNGSVNKALADIHSDDTTDIDVIKKNEADESFFTSSYEFSKKDFSLDDDFYEEDKSSGLFKIILLALAIVIFIGVIAYFVLNYGIGI